MSIKKWSRSIVVTWAEGRRKAENVQRRPRSLDADIKCAEKEGGYVSRG